MVAGRKPASSAAQRAGGRRDGAPPALRASRPPARRRGPSRARDPYAPPPTPPQPIPGARSHAHIHSRPNESARATHTHQCFIPPVFQATHSQGSAGRRSEGPLPRVRVCLGGGGRARQLGTAVVLHAFCNYMGFPDFARMASHPLRVPLLAALFAVSESPPLPPPYPRFTRRSLSRIRV